MSVFNNSALNIWSFNFLFYTLQLIKGRPHTHTQCVDNLILPESQGFYSQVTTFSSPKTSWNLTKKRRRREKERERKKNTTQEQEVRERSQVWSGFKVWPPSRRLRHRAFNNSSGLFFLLSLVVYVKFFSAQYFKGISNHKTFVEKDNRLINKEKSLTMQFQSSSTDLSFSYQIFDVLVWKIQNHWKRPVSLSLSLFLKEQHHFVLFPNRKKTFQHVDDEFKNLSIEMCPSCGERWISKTRVELIAAESKQTAITFKECSGCMGNCGVRKISNV